MMGVSEGDAPIIQTDYQNFEDVKGKEKVNLQNELYTVGLDEKAGSTGKGWRYTSLSDGDRMTFVPLTGKDTTIGLLQHSWWSERLFVPCSNDGNCPGCDVDENNPRQLYFLPIVVIDKATKERTLEVWQTGPMVIGQLKGFAEFSDEDDFKGYVFGVTRQGSGLNTKYAVTPLNKRIEDSELEEFEIPGPDEMIKITTKEGAVTALVKAGKLTETQAKDYVSDFEIPEDSDEDDEFFSWD